MFASAPLSEPQVFMSTVIVTAASIFSIVLCVVGGLGYYQSKTAAKD